MAYCATCNSGYYLASVTATTCAGTFLLMLRMSFVQVCAWEIKCVSRWNFRLQLLCSCACQLCFCPLVFDVYVFCHAVLATGSVATCKTATGNAICTECNTGYYLSGYSCIANPASPAIGPAVAGTPDTLCATIGTGVNMAYCATCQTGYYLASATATACTGALLKMPGGVPLLLVEHVWELSAK